MTPRPNKISSILKNEIDKIKLPKFIETNINTIQTNRKLNSQFREFYDIVVDIYSKLDIKKIKKKYNRTIIFKDDNKCSLIYLFKYLYDNNIIDQYILSKKVDTKESNEFKSILDNNDLTKCAEWINIRGQDFMNKMFILIQNETIKRQILPESLLHNLNIVDNNLYGEFTPIEVLHEIETLINYKHTFHITYENLILNLIVFDYKKNINKKMVHSYINRILFMGLLKSHSIYKNKEKHEITLNLTLILTKKTKKISNEYKTLGAQQINSGITSYSPLHNDFFNITIYRIEELNKLIIHELVHALKFDFISLSFPDYYNLVNMNTKITPNESYTEILACMLNCILCAYEERNKKGVVTFRRAIHHLQNEIKYSYFQVAKILCHFGYENADDFFREYDQSRDNRFDQTTNVFSYFVIKTSLFCGLKDFYQFFSKYNYMLTLVCDNTLKKDEYIGIARKSLSSNSFKKIIGWFMKYIQTNLNKQNQITISTLRMTLTELDY